MSIFKLMHLLKRPWLQIKNDAGKVYLLRYYLCHIKWFSLKLHFFFDDDDACMHDHPWTFISIILAGGYIEHTPSGKKFFRPFSILFRKAEHLHRIELKNGKRAISIVLTFKDCREWGFATPDGWVHWKQYEYRGQCK